MKQLQSNNHFYKYVIPSMISLLLSGVYSIVDGLFIGRNIGDIGLAAINIAWPISALQTALGIGLGSGGAALMSLRQGENRKEEAFKARGNTILLLFGVSIIITILLLFTFKDIVYILGARKETYKIGLQYARIMIIGGFLQIFGTGFLPILRNSGKTIEAMCIMITGMAVNLLLDAYFIITLHMGMEGAALATIIGQGSTAVLSIIVLMMDKNNPFTIKQFKPDKHIMAEITKIGFSPFGISIGPSIVIIFTNLQCLKYGGDMAVASYAVISYVVCPVLSLFAGIGEGIQPLISYYMGAKEKDLMKETKKKAHRLALCMSIVLMVVIILLKDEIPSFFGVSKEASKMVSQGLVIATFAFPFMGMVRLASSYYYATQKLKRAMILIYGESWIITPVFLGILPFFFQIYGIWFVLPTTWAILFILIQFMNRRDIA